jgi:hypothetical protein
MDEGKLLLILVGIGGGSFAVSRLLGLSADLSAMIGFILVFPAYLLVCACFDDRNEQRDIKKENPEEKRRPRCKKFFQL